jgi:hypothetical protein
VLNERGDEDVLALGDVGADLDCKLGKCVNASVFHGQTLPMVVASLLQA